MKPLTIPRSRQLFFPLFLPFLFLGVLYWVLIATVQPAAAMTCVVPSGSYASIQSAVDDVTCSAIQLEASTYMENVTIGRSVVISGTGSTGPDATTINAGGSGRGVTISGTGVIVHLSNMAIINGNATSASPSARFGGGIAVLNEAVLHGQSLYVANNRASTAAQTGFGGGIAINGATAYLTSTIVYSNAGSLRTGVLHGLGVGGGLYLATGNLSLVNSTIEANVANHRSQGILAAGGGLYVGEGATANLQGNWWGYNLARGLNSSCASCIFTNASADGGAIAVVVGTGVAEINIMGNSFISNTADISNEDLAGNNEKVAGGAISLLASNTTGQITANIYDSYFEGNIAKAGSGTGEGRGGAIHARHAMLTVQRSLIINNQAALAGNGYGGGIYVREQHLDNALNLVNSMLADNLARGLGDGAQVYVNYTGGSAGRTVDITHVTIANNGLNPKQGIFYISDDASHRFRMVNTIIAHHAIGIRNVNTTGHATANYMLFHGNTANQGAASTAFPSPVGWVVGDPDPLFVAPLLYDFHLQAGSPAINAGTDAGVTDDYDGDPRPLGGGFDIGADETTPELAVYYDATPIAQMDSVNYGTTPVGTSITRTFTIRNVGSADLFLNALNVMGSHFSVADDFADLVVAPNETTTFSVQFEATMVGFYTGTVQFNSNDFSQDPFVFYVEGTVIAAGAPAMVVSEGGMVLPHMGMVDFGKIYLGSSAVRTITISNTGTTNLHLSNLSVMGSGFGIASGFGNSVVAPNGYTTFAVELNGMMANSYTATVQFNHNDGTVSNPFSFTVTGEVLYATYLPMVTRE